MRSLALADDLNVSTVSWAWKQVFIDAPHLELSSRDVPQAAKACAPVLQVRLRRMASIAGLFDQEWMVVSALMMVQKEFWVQGFGCKL